jgi:ABC-type branched-subunit amino acid transport system substrate-binding protein
MGLPFGRWASLALFAASSVCCIEAYDEGGEPGDVVVGALLPFAGDQAGTGPNLERALMLLAEDVNETGGVGGRRVRFEVRDGHTDERGAAKAARELIEGGAVAVIGPVTAETAGTVLPILQPANVLAITGAWTADPGSGSSSLINTAPSGQVLASVLATRARVDGVRRIAVVHVADPYGRPVAKALSTAFGGAEFSLSVFEIGEDETRFQDLASNIQAFAADAVVLVTYVRQATDLALALPKTQLYLTSTLKNDLRLRNAPPAVFEGAVGVSPAVSTDFAVFARTFRERWDEEPLEEAAFFYDAGALVMLALQSTLSSGEPLSATQLRPKLIDLSRAPRGQTAPWFELGAALQRVGAQRVVNYRGVSGAVDLNDEGQVGRGLVQLWQVQDGKIVSLGTTAASE